MLDVDIRAGLAVIIAVLLLQGCGHKGPLMLPPSRAPAPQVQPAQIQVPATSQPAPDAQHPDTSSAQPAQQP